MIKHVGWAVPTKYRWRALSAKCRWWAQPTLLLFAATTVWGQDPFAVPGAGAPAEGAKKEADPFSADGKAAPAAADGGKKKAEPPKEVIPDTLPIKLLRDSNPTTPPDLLHAAQAALELGRPDESKRYLAKLLAAKPADNVLAALTSKYGDLVLRLVRTKEVQPEGQQTADLISQAAQRLAQDPERMKAIIAKLSAPELRDRLAALDQLTTAGAHAVTPLLAVLADTAREPEHRNVRAALVRLGGAVEQPLIGALETQNDALKAQVIAVLARMESKRATRHLVRLAADPQVPAAIHDIAAAALTKIIGAAPDAYEARRYLSQEVTRFSRGESPDQADADGQIEVWSWDDAKGEVSSRKLPQRDAAIQLAARLAKDLYALQPDDKAAQKLMLLTNLEAAKVLGGLDQPLPFSTSGAGGLAVQAGPLVVSQVLADAMQQGRVPAAIAAAEVLGQIGDAAALYTSGGNASPLAEALRFSDRRVRIAAALAAVKLAPGKSFPGAGRVAKTLGWFADTSGADSVLVGHPQGEAAQTLVGMLNEIGYDGRSSYVGEKLAAEAFANPDFQFILIADAIDQPAVKDLVQWLRRDFRTARTPIGVMARGEQLEALQFAFADDQFTTVFPRVFSTSVAAIEIERLKAIAGRNLVGHEERTVQALAALKALATLSRDPGNLSSYELLRQEPVLIRALNNPALAADAAGVLASFGTPKSQMALADFAGLVSHSLADRQAAASAFAAAVKLRGVLLTQSQIAAQYARYNASEKLDQPTQELLGSILDAIETRAVARGDIKKTQ